MNELDVRTIDFLEECEGRIDNMYTEPMEIIQALQSENKKLREALGFYADDNNWRAVDARFNTVLEIEGDSDVAKKALGKKE